MILDTLQNHALYTTVHPLFREAFHYLERTDFNALADGKHIIDEDNLFALISSYDTKPEAGARAESHRKYIDIQVLLSGSEKIGHTPLNGQSPVVEYDEAKEIMFYDTPCSFFTMKPGMFVVFFPEDVHLPGIEANGTGKVRKVVMKVRC